MRPVMSPVMSPVVNYGYARRKGGGLPWYPNRLFQSGDILLWYDPSDLTTMFTNTTGTTQVAADGDSVALMLDKGQWGGKTLAQVLAAQTELVPHPQFSSDTSWTAAGGWAIDTGTGEASIVSSAGSAKLYPTESPATLFNSGHFRVVIDVESVTGTITLQSEGGGGGVTSYGNLAAGTNTLIIKAPNPDVQVEITAGAGASAVITGFSIKQIPGYHRTQATGTSMPKYKTGPNPAAAENSPEAATNGDFAADASWSKGSGVTISGGTANFSAVSAGIGLFQNAGITFQSGTAYRIKVTVSNYTSGTPAVRIAASGSFTNLTPAGNNTYTLVLTAGATNAGLQVVEASANGTYSIDNVSVKEIPASAPYIHWLLYDGTDDGHATGTIPFNTVTSDGLARRNLLTVPDKFDHTTWAKTRVTVTGNAATAPDGSTTADKLVEDSTAASTRYIQTPGSTVPSGTSTFSVYAKAGERSWLGLSMTTSGVQPYAFFNLGSGTVGTVGSSGGTITTIASIEDVGDGWYRCSVTWGIAVGNIALIFPSTADNTFSYSGDGTSGIYIWGAQLEAGATLTDFQNIGTDEVAVCAGVTKSSDAAQGIVAELSVNTSANVGSFAIIAPGTNATGDYRWRVGGSTNVNNSSATSFSAPVTNVLTAIGDISGDSAILRADGAETINSSADQGTGNFGSYAMYFGRRAGTSAPFNGREYQTVIRSRLLSASELSSLETFVAAKTGVIL